MSLRRFGSAATATIVATTALVVATPAAAALEDPVTRLYGANRYATAVAFSRDVFGRGNPAGAVVLARGDDFADGLAGVPLAADKNGPMLLTPPTSLHPDTAAEIDRVLPGGGTVYILGSTSAVSKAVENSVVARGHAVRRLQGESRYKTAVVIALEVDRPQDVFVTTGRDFPDALAAGATAAAYGGVVVLSDDGVLPFTTRAYLDSATTDPDVRVIAVGRPAATATRDFRPSTYVGTDRYQTAALLAAAFFPAARGAAVASGVDFPDALAGGPHAAAHRMPLLLTQATSLPTPSAAFLRRRAAELRSAVVYGSPGVISDSVVNQIQNAIS